MTLWYFNIDDFPDEEVQSVLLNLPDVISNEIDRYRCMDDKKCRLISRLLLQKYVVENNQKWNWDAWKRSSTHKPYLDQGPLFNISHSGKIVLIGFSEEMELGIDIEQINKVDAEALSIYFHEDELTFLEKNNFSKDDFYKIWTRKEALLKAIGIGFLEGLNQISTIKDIVYYQNEWYLYEIQLVEGYKCCVCTSNEVKNINSKQIDYFTLNNFIHEKILL